jgi:hypothetical protein
VALPLATSAWLLGFWGEEDMLEATKSSTEPIRIGERDLENNLPRRKRYNMYLFSSIQTFRGAQDKEITILQDVSCRKIHPAARQTWNLNKVRKVSPCKSNVVAW